MDPAWVGLAIGLFMLIGADWIMRQRNRMLNLQMNEAQIRQVAMAIRVIGVVAALLTGSILLT